MLTKGADITETRSGFGWNIPTHFNIGVDICDRPAAQHPDKIAIIDVDPDFAVTRYNFRQLRDMSNILANALSRHCQEQDRIGVLLPQGIITATAHAAIPKLGCIALPLFTLFGPEALQHRLQDSGTKVLLTNAMGAAMIAKIRPNLPDLALVISVDGRDDNAISYADFTHGMATTFTPVQTRADDPALLIYTSGTTGNPKGALHAHRVLLGHLPGVEMSHNFFPQSGDCIWTPADWAWIGGLLDVLMPALHHGVPVVACRFRKFTPEAAFRLIQDHNIQNTFLPPTALKMMQLAPADLQPKFQLRSVASGGEPLGKELIAWGRTVFGTTINEFYGQTECNMIVSSCADLAPAEPGIMGFAVPGHHVDIIEETTQTCLGQDQVGTIAIRAPDPVMFLKYWNNPDATDAKYLTIDDQKWLLTGDKGYKTQSGRIGFLGRDDDIISSGGYRIGPAEIEDCIQSHPAVELVGVVGKPDPVRGAVVAAYVQLSANHAPSDALADDIAAHVKTQLAAYEFPRIVRFIDQMPMTTTGKIIRSQLRQLAEKEAKDDH
ncbi:AMP-binding protein [Aestuariibius sp. HNIBRBA575]|uniref:AMP-binding protein n=1 Tax=Aestuariibius sp. HNIBRBA575 TaxID=3233343 RepID=UPI0034A4C984